MSEAVDEEPHEVVPERLRYGKNLALFALTVCSVFLAGAIYAGELPEHPTLLGMLRALPRGYKFAVPLLAILLTHEFGHFFAARYHKVPASLPFFIPLPFLSPFGTMGAVISMRGRIRSRNALLDIGASGPLAGLVVALPIWCVGIATSRVEALSGPYTQEGQSLLYLALKRILAGPIPDGSDLAMNSLAFAGWAGALVTMLNLVPVGQLDGGHIAYALLGSRQNGYATWIHRLLLLVFAFNLARFVVPVLRDRAYADLSQAIGNSLFWLVWFGLIGLMKRASGVNHPPTDPSSLSPRRRLIAALCLGIFVLLFMPTPWATMG